MTIATWTDVQNRLGRPLTPLEKTRVSALLEDLEVEIMRYAKDRLTDPDWVAAVKSVSCAAVLRAARLPDGLTNVVPAEEGAGFSSAPNTQGAVYLRRSERRTLGLPLTGSVSIVPEPLVKPASEEGWYGPWFSSSDDCFEEGLW
jgi:Phage protein Gp19/Gp15/Gp42